MEQLVNALKSIAEPTRLRLLAILANNELTVSEITEVLNYSQPRISRHLKLMCDAGILDRVQEGAWVFYKAKKSGVGGDLVKNIVELLPLDSQVVKKDSARLNEIYLEQAKKAAEYFEENASQWDSINQLYFSSDVVNDAILEEIKQVSNKYRKVYDLGSGTGNLVELLSEYAESVTGIDNSLPMLTIARAMLNSKSISNCDMRQGDICEINASNESADLITMKHVLHYMNNPLLIFGEAARLLRIGGKFILVDFASHNVERLRTDYAHRRLGFTNDDIQVWCDQSKLKINSVKDISKVSIDDEQLTVRLWIMEKIEA